MDNQQKFTREQMEAVVATLEPIRKLIMDQFINTPRAVQEQADIMSRVARAQAERLDDEHAALWDEYPQEAALQGVAAAFTTLREAPALYAMWQLVATIETQFELALLAEEGGQE